MSGFVIMKVTNNILQISFCAKIIDSHIHRGTETSYWNGRSFPKNQDSDKFLRQPLKVNVNGNIQTDTIEKIVISSVDGLAWSEAQEKEFAKFGKTSEIFDKVPAEKEFTKNETECNTDMIKLYQNDKFNKILAVCQPTKTNGNANNIRELINEHKGLFV